MEAEIDLRPFFSALWRRWQILVICVVTAVIITAVFIISRPDTHTTRADVLILSSQSRLSFDERFVTDDLPNADTRRQALVALATSAALEADVREQLPPELLDEDYHAGDLAREVRVESTGDLLHVFVTDPDEQFSRTLAEVWGHTFTHAVNNLYSENDEFVQEIESQLSEARSRYDQAQQDLEEFIGTNERVTLQQQISTLQELLADSRRANQALYTQYLSRTHELDLILQDAQTLREQSEAGQPADLAENLALLALRTRAVGQVELPVDLRFENAESLAQAGAVSPSDLDRLIAVIEQRRNELVAVSRQLAEAIVSGSEQAGGLPADLRAQYEEELTALNRRLEQQNARERLLVQQRDLALDALSILQSKLNEQRVARSTPDVEVRYVSAAIVPESSRMAQFVLAGLAAIVVGLMLGTLIIVYLELVRPRLRTHNAGVAGERPAERPVQDVA